MSRRQRPLIGLTTYGPEGDPESVSLPINYGEAVAAAGGNAVLLAPYPIPADEVLDALDAVIFAGGGDITPTQHGADPHPTLYGMVERRDAFELELARRAFDRPGLPILGICRGMQILNVALGGDLDLHLPDARGEKVLHRLPFRKPTLHTVRLVAGTLLDEIYACAEFPVCSWHHQGIRTLGRGLQAAAHAADDLIEAFVHDSHPFAVGLQWHPELQIEQYPLQRKIFEALVERARSRA